MKPFEIIVNDATVAIDTALLYDIARQMPGNALVPAVQVLQEEIRQRMAWRAEQDADSYLDLAAVSGALGTVHAKDSACKSRSGKLLMALARAVYLSIMPSLVIRCAECPHVMEPGLAPCEHIPQHSRYIQLSRNSLRATDIDQYRDRLLHKSVVEDYRLIRRQLGGIG